MQTNDKPIWEMTNAEYHTWLAEAEKAEQQRQAAMDNLFEAWFNCKYTKPNNNNRQMLKQATNQGVNS